MFQMQIVSRGYLKCKRCGTIFTPTITDAPCISGDGSSPGEWCVDCEHFRQYYNNNPKCPACGNDYYKRISCAEARLINYFRK